MKHDGLVAFSATAVLCGAGLLALSLLGTAFGRERFGGDLYLEWSSNTAVWIAELAFAGLAIAVGVLATVAMRADATIARHIVGWLSLSILALGVLSIAAGWTGLQIPGPGVDVLERGELLYILGGVIAILFGLVLSAVALSGPPLTHDG